MIVAHWLKTLVRRNRSTQVAVRPTGLVAVRRRRRVGRLTVAGMVETLEDRTVLAAVIPGLDTHGVLITNTQAAGLATLSVTSSSNSQLSNNAQGSGLMIDLNGSSPALSNLKKISITDVTVSNNGNAGVQIRLRNLNLDSLIIDRAKISGSGGSGLVIDLTNSVIKELVIYDSTNVASPAIANSGASRINGNNFDGINFTARNSAVNTLGVAGNVVESNVGHGMYFNLEGASIGVLGLTDNEVRTNTAGSGIHFETNRANVGSVTGAVRFNTFSGNSSHGLSFRTQSLLPGNSQPTASPSNFDFAFFSDNAFVNNGGSGVSVDLRAQTTFDATVLRNNFTGNQLRGFDVKAADTGTASPDPLTGDFVVGQRAFDIQIGDLTVNGTGDLINGNVFETNRGAAIAMELNDTTNNVGFTTGRFRILGNRITGTTGDPGSLIYNGQGINIRARGAVASPNGSAIFQSSVIDRNSINNNAGDGILLDIREDSELTDLVIGNTTGVNQTFDINGNANGGGDVPTVQGDGNVITGNGGNGISILRRDSAIVQRVRILDNRITNNAEGVYLQASNAYQTVQTAPRPNLRVVNDFVLNHNDISSNRVNGVHLRTEFNAVLLANMRYNRIDGNTLNGVRVTGLENNITDFENVGGLWVKNAITNNGIGRAAADEHGNGIRIENIVGSVNPLVIGRDGVDAGDQQSLGNFISGNGSDGIEVGARAGAGGTVMPNDTRDGLEIVNNLITENGKNGVGNPLTAGKGIDIEVLIGQPREFRIDRNVISGNAGDGIELLNHGGLMRVTADGNTIDGNGGRGVDLLNQLGGSLYFPAESYVVFGGPVVADRNLITRNGLEGFYVVNTAAYLQRQDVDSRDAFVVATISGSRVEAVDAANLTLDIENNEITNNGLGVPDLQSPASTLSGTGLVVRVGSQRSGSSTSTVGDISGEADYFLDGAAAGVGSNINQGVGTVSFAGRGTRANGRVNLRVVDNDLRGNGGDDVFIEPFISLQPRTTGGTWNGTEFRDISNYDRDPLARVNVVFTGNIGDSLDVARGIGSTTYNNQVGYTNGEGTFKSRTGGRTAPDPNGPFGNRPDRARSSTRLADRPVSVQGSFVGLGSAWPDTYSESGTSGTPYSGPNTAQAGVGAGFTGTIASVGGTDGNGALVVNVASRSGGISDATNANPTVITSANHGLITGQTITISGATGNTAINGTWIVNVTGGSTFQIRDPNTLALVAGNGTLGGNASWTLNGFHGLQTGDYIGISGTFTPADGTHRVVVIDSDSFALYLPTSAGLIPVRGEGDVADATNTPATVVTIVDHGLTTGDEITITGATGNTAINGTWLVQNVFDSNGVLDADRIRLFDPNTSTFVNANGVYTGGAEWEFVLANVGFGSFTERNLGAFQFDGIGPSTFRIERGWDATGFDENTNGDDFNSFGGIESGGYSTSWDTVAAGTFSFMTVTIGDTTVNKGGTAELTVRLSEPARETTTILYRLSDGSARADANNDGDTIDGDFVVSRGGISGATNTNPVVITSANHGLVNGDVVTITGALGNTAINTDNNPATANPTNWIVERIDNNSFRLRNPATNAYAIGNGNYVAGTAQWSAPQAVRAVTFLAGQSEATIQVGVRAGALAASGSQFYVDLFQTTFGEFADSRGVVTILEPPTISVSDGTPVVEGDTGQTRQMTFTVTLSEDPVSDVSVVVQTLPLGVNQATAGVDYVTIPPTVLTWNAGDPPTKTITVDILADSIQEPTESFGLFLSNATNGTIVDGTGLGLITDNDTPRASINDVVVSEADGTMTFTVSLDKPAGLPVKLFFNVDGTATAADRTVVTASPIEFAAGETTKQITVNIVNDALVEAPETVVVTLSPPPGGTNAVIEDGVGIGTINDDDAPFVSIASPAAVVEGDGTKTLTFTVTLSKAPVAGFPVTVNYTTAAGTASAGTDFQAQTGSITFGAGETSKTISITVIGDLLPEATETFQVNLTGATNAAITTGQATGTITDDDTPSITIADAGATEGSGFVDVTVRLSKAVGVPVTVDYSVVPGTALANSDYNGSISPLNGTLTFGPNTTTSTIRIRLLGGGGAEPVETFSVVLSNPTVGTIADGSATVRIIDETSTIGLVTAPNAGLEPRILVYDAQGNPRLNPSFYAYSPAFRNGVRVATGDVDGDGVTDIVVAPVSGVAPIRVFRSDSYAEIANFFPFAPGYTGGVSIAVGDIDKPGVDNDGRAEIFVSTTSTNAADGGTSVRIFRVVNRTAELASPHSNFFAFAPHFTGGALIAAGDVNGDGRADAILTPVSGAGPAVRMVDYANTLINSFYAFDANFTGGANIAVGDVNGDGVADVIASVRGGAQPTVRVFNNYTGTLLSSFQAFSPAFFGGVNIGVGDVNFDGRADVIATPASSSSAAVRFFDGVSGAILKSVVPNYPGSFTNGVFVAGQLINGLGQPLQLAGSAGAAGAAAAAVTQAQVQTLAQAAVAKLAAAGGAAAAAKLASVQITVGDLPANYVGVARPGSIVIDLNAGGLGWFVDETPSLDEEFSRGADGVYRAIAPQAQGRVDLLTVLTHELAHLLGLEDVDSSVAPNSLMTSTVTGGVRRATNEHLDDLFADGAVLSELLTV